MQPLEDSRSYDVLVIGGGPAGLSAALVLGRSRRRVAVLDAGAPRHAVADGVHNLLTRDGMPPAALRAEAWVQMAAYPTVEHLDGLFVRALERNDDLWIADAGDAGRFTARAVLLATGVVDHHPDIDGFEALWGDSIQHCPFCHGWELRDRALAALYPSDLASHMAPLLRSWSDDVVVLTHGARLGPDALAILEAAGVPVDTRRIAALEGDGARLERVRFEDGTSMARGGIFVQPDQSQTGLVRSLELETVAHPMNRDGLVAVDVQQRTSREMLWAAGDLCSPMPAVVSSAAEGTRAGAVIHHVLTSGLHGAWR